MPIKVISGGQTGIDRMSLEVAREVGVPSGGSAPKDFLTENGPDLSLKDFGLVALPKKEYKARTLKNVIDGDGTVIYGDLTGGTRRLAIDYRRGKALSRRPTVTASQARLPKYKIRKSKIPQSTTARA